MTYPKEYRRRHLTRPVLRLLVLLITSLAIAGCGYHVSGGKSYRSADSAMLPGGVKTLSIPYFMNNTSRAGVESIITDAMVAEFKTTAEITDKDPDARLIGKVTHYELSPVAFTSNDIVQTYRLNVTLMVKFFASDGLTLLWGETAIRDYEDFNVDTSDISSTKEAERKAFKDMSYDMARIVKERILEGFLSKSE